jgi:histidinol-phosphate/aromatic aminotransferase/cobyric acid decarboxylase-like protein
MADNRLINLQFTTVEESVPEFIWEGLEEYVTASNRYQPQPKELRQRLARKHNVSEEMIYLTAGIDEALLLLAATFGKRTQLFTPCYIEYQRFVEQMGGAVLEEDVLSGVEYAVPVKRLPMATMIVLANPNNPAGFMSKDKLVRLADVNSHCPVVVDEAYAGYANLSVMEFVRTHENLIVLRSFSKDYGMAGVRIGYMVGHPEVIRLAKEKGSWANVSYLAVGAAMVALDHEEYFKELRQSVTDRRIELMAFFRQRGILVLPNRINAVLLRFETAMEAAKFVHHLDERQILVTHGNGESMIGLSDKYVRMTVGTEEQIERVKEAVRKFR